MWTARGARPWRARVQRRHRPSPPVSQLVAWFHDAGLADARIDAVGNVRGGAGPPAPRATLLLGSHYDTVTDAGAFDGALGLAAALAAVKAVAAAGAAGGCGAPPPAAAWRRRVEVVAFADEEGVRFGTTFLGSGALARGGWAGVRQGGRHTWSCSRCTTCGGWPCPQQWPSQSPPPAVPAWECQQL